MIWSVFFAGSKRFVAITKRRGVQKTVDVLEKKDAFSDYVAATPNISFPERFETKNVRCV